MGGFAHFPSAPLPVVVDATNLSFGGNLGVLPFPALRNGQVAEVCGHIWIALKGLGITLFRSERRAVNRVGLPALLGVPSVALAK